MLGLPLLLVLPAERRRHEPGTHRQGDDPEPVPRRRHHAADRRRPAGDRPSTPVTRSRSSTCSPTPTTTPATSSTRPTTRPAWQLLAGELLTHKPDLVGLQEVAIWRHRPHGQPVGRRLPQDQCDRGRLRLPGQRCWRETNSRGASQGVEYKAISVAKRADVEGPAYDGQNQWRGATDRRDVRLTMHDVILMRVGGPVKYVKGSKGGRDLRREPGLRPRQQREHGQRDHVQPRLRVGRTSLSGDYSVPVPQHALRSVRVRHRLRPGRAALSAGAGGYKGTAILDLRLQLRPAGRYRSSPTRR